MSGPVITSYPFKRILLSFQNMGNMPGGLPGQGGRGPNERKEDDDAKKEAKKKR